MKAAAESTLTRSDVQWSPTGEKACACGKLGCLICQVEALTEPVDDGAELDAEVVAAQFDNDPDIYAGTDDDGFCGDDY